MAQVYSDQKREDDDYALPDVEVFWHDGKRTSGDDCWADSDGEPSLAWEEKRSGTTYAGYEAARAAIARATE